MNTFTESSLHELLKCLHTITSLPSSLGKGKLTHRTLIFSLPMAALLIATCPAASYARIHAVLDIL